MSNTQSGPQVLNGPARLSARSAWWVFLWAALLACLYLPTLATRFDFIDDGNLVYPARPMPPAQRIQRVAERIRANYEHLGPFRPVLWVHWEAAADLFEADAFRWRCARLVWTGLAAGALLWLLRELGVRPAAAVLAAALAMWNPFRNEVWTSLTLAEGVAMPYALMSLVCAVRAARSRRAWAWDVAGVLCVLAALGCKNTFAALVPVQMLLRIAPDGRDLRAGMRTHGWRAGLLGLTLLAPVAHYVYFKLHWHPGQYSTGGASLAQLGRMARALLGAVSIEYVGAGLAVAVIAILVWGRRAGAGTEGGCPGLGLLAVWREYRAACLAGILLLVLGVGVYLPIGAVSGRYTMPAIWGADLLIAALLSTLLGISAGWWKRAAVTLTVCGLAAVALANLGRQQKFAARADLLWQTLEWVERQSPPGECVAWVSSPELNIEEGVHFAWHLQARGRSDVCVRLCDAQGQREVRCEVQEAPRPPAVFITGSPAPPPGGGASPLSQFSARYWFNHRAYQCYLWPASLADGR